MQILETRAGATLVLSLQGRLDSVSAQSLENVIKVSLGGIERLVFDFAGLSYVSSAGLRVLLSAQKQMNKQGEMALRNVSASIMEVFEITGFSGILTVE